MPERAELRRKTGQICLLIASYKRLEKRPISDRPITPAADAVCVPAHLELPGSSQAKQLHHFHAQLSLGAELPQAKKSSLYVRRVTLVMSNSL